VEFLQVSQLLYCFVICPISILIYESDPNLPVCRRIGKAIKVQLPVFISIIFMITVTQLFFSVYRLPSYVAEQYGLEINYTSPTGK
jgi:hypothetical protein